MKLLQDNMVRQSMAVIIPLLFIFSIQAFGQPDENPPLSPRFTLLTINPTNNHTELRWNLSPSPDVAGYIVYSYKNDAGTAIDTIFDPQANSYSIFWPWSLIQSESFVVAAIDYSDNISPLSNDLSTIYAEARLDTCNHKIILNWNPYANPQDLVAGYNIYFSVNNGNLSLADHVTEDNTLFIFNEFITDAHYCFVVEAELGNDQISTSNIPCLDTDMQKSPLWINADYATVSKNGEIILSFTVDPESETNLYSLEKKSEKDGNYIEIVRLESSEGKITYNDITGDPEIINSYRLSAINNCNIPTTISNNASNIVLKITESDNELVIFWNQYREWLGITASNRLFMDTGNGFIEIASFDPQDTICKISIPEIMYDVVDSKICFYVTATETGNPHGIIGSESVSNTCCYTIKEIITVPNIFSPNGDGINDFFRPVITFSPISYKLIITDRRRKTLFESDDYTESWNGTEKGKQVPQDVYLWFLRILTPSGENISRTGTLTVIY